MGDDGVGTGASGRHDDAFDELRLDDSFVSGAAINEGSHRDREKQAKRQHRRHRRGQRTRGVGRWFRRYAPLLLAAVVLVIAVGFGSRGQGPLGTVDAIRRLGGTEADARDAPVAPVAASGTTSTTLGLVASDKEPGDCLIWKQDEGGVGRRDVRTVACDQPHLLEVTSTFEIDGSPYDPTTGPTDADWDAVRNAECVSRAAAYLGYPLDDAGRFDATMLMPQPDSWASGYRTVTCAIELRSVESMHLGQDRTYDEFVGVVAGADQTRLWATGTCIGPSVGNDLGDVVPCDVPHEQEVVGVADLSALGPVYPGVDAVNEATRAQCPAVAEAVYGGPLPSTVASWTLGIAESSWIAGRRLAECTIGLRAVAGDGWAVTSAPVRAATAG